MFGGDDEPAQTEKRTQTEQVKTTSVQDTTTEENTAVQPPTRQPPVRRSTSSSEEFYTLRQDVDSLKRELRALRRFIRNTGSDISPFLLQKELKKVLSFPEVTHEIELINGTTVRGKILRETVDNIVIQTQIGHLTLERNLIKSTRKAEPTRAKVVINGPIEEEIYDGKRIYRGRVKNDGLRRADFVRVVFQLSNSAAQIVATDSAFVDGNTHMYNTSILSDTSVEPGETASFVCQVFIPPGSKINYYTYEIHWTEE